MNREERTVIVKAALAGAKHRAGWYRTHCPFCQGRDDSFSYNPETSYYHCFRCPVRGKLESADDLDFDKPAPEQINAEQEALTRPPDGYFPLAGDESESLAAARDYMHSRNIPERVWHEAQVGACAWGIYAGRIVIPNLMPDGSWYGYTTRVWGKPIDKKAKYRYPKGSWRGNVLHNQPALWADTADDEHLYVVEGAFDALALWPHAVAVMGMPSEKQIALMVTSTRPLVVVLDADAWEKGMALAMRLRLEGCRAGHVRLLDGADPDEVDSGELWEAARESLVSF